jgi:hypothetical protein
MSPRRSGRLRAARVMLAAWLIAAALAPAGCAPLPPARPVTDLNLIAGQWRGQITFRGGPYQLFYLTINPDGTLIGAWDGMTRWGKISFDRGRTRFGMYIWSGSVDYLEGGGERVLLLKEDFAHWDAIVRPLK